MKARKPLSEPNVAQNVLRWGTGALNIDGTRIAGPMDTAHYGGQQLSSIGYQGTQPKGFQTQEHPSGRWPANILLDEEAAAMLDEQSGETKSASVLMPLPLTPGDALGASHGERGISTFRGHDDAGGASRFFYVAKADRDEREEGVDGQNTHPTVKPVDVMRWLCRLVTPPGGLVLDPFLGSGTTGIAALEEGFRFVGIEKDAAYLEIARQRIFNRGYQQELF